MGKAMQAAVSEYMQYRSKRPGGSARSVHTVQSVLRRMAVAWDKTNRSPRSVDAVWLEDWLLDLGVSSNSLTAYESYVIGFMEWAERRGVVTREVWRWERNGKSTLARTKPFLWLPPTFFQELIASQKDFYFRGLLATMTYTLGRGIEIRERKLMDVRMSDRQIFWTRSKTGDYNDFMPMVDELYEELERYLFGYGKLVGDLHDHFQLFPRYTNRFGKYPTLYPEIQRGPVHDTVKRLIEPHIDPALLAADPDLLKGEGGHTIRRSQARNLYESLVAQGLPEPLGSVQATLGHKNRDMTERYIGLDSGRQARDAALKGRSFWGAPAAPVVDIAAATTRRMASGS